LKTFASGSLFEQYRFNSNAVSGFRYTDYLIDSYNHTGYAQTFEETTGANTTAYIIGDDVLAQVSGTTATDIDYLLYDGHGSTRQLISSNGTTVVDSYSYDAYGVMLGGNPQTPAGTNLLYAGEHFDTDVQHYYNRARWYNPLNGLFNRTDPYSGNKQDPQSLHKYLYCHNNPVNATDPSGMLGIIGVTISIAIISLVSGLIAGAINKFLFGGSFLNTFIQVTMATFLALSMSAIYPPIAPWAYTIATFITQVLWEWIVNGFNDPAESIARILFMTILTGLLGFAARGLNVSQFGSFNSDRLIHALGVKDAVGRITIEIAKSTFKGLSVFAGIKRIAKELFELFVKLSKMPRRDLEREYYRRTTG